MPEKVTSIVQMLLLLLLIVVTKYQYRDTILLIYPGFLGADLTHHNKPPNCRIIQLSQMQTSPGVDNLAHVSQGTFITINPIKIQSLTAFEMEIPKYSIPYTIGTLDPLTEQLSPATADVGGFLRECSGTSTIPDYNGEIQSSGRSVGMDGGIKFADASAGVYVYRLAYTDDQGIAREYSVAYGVDSELTKESPPRVCTTTCTDQENIKTCKESCKAPLDKCNGYYADEEVTDVNNADMVIRSLYNPPYEGARELQDFSVFKNKIGVSGSYKKDIDSIKSVYKYRQKPIFLVLSSHGTADFFVKHEDQGNIKAYYRDSSDSTTSFGWGIGGYVNKVLFASCCTALGYDTNGNHLMWTIAGASKADVCGFKKPTYIVWHNWRRPAHIAKSKGDEIFCTGNTPHP